MLLSGAPDTTAFETDVGEVLCLTLRRDDIVMMDNLAVQKNLRSARVSGIGGGGDASSAFQSVFIDDEMVNAFGCDFC